MKFNFRLYDMTPKELEALRELMNEAIDMALPAAIELDEKDPTNEDDLNAIERRHYRELPRILRYQRES